MNNDKGPSGFSIVALVTGIIGMSVIPIIFGSIDLVNIKNGLESPRGKGFDIAGIALGSLRILIIISIIIFVLVWVFTGNAESGCIFGIPIHGFKYWR
jgi:hypothetical protein